MKEMRFSEVIERKRAIKRQSMLGPVKGSQVRDSEDKTVNWRSNDRGVCIEYIEDKGTESRRWESAISEVKGRIRSMKRW